MVLSRRGEQGSNAEPSRLQLRLALYYTRIETCASLFVTYACNVAVVAMFAPLFSNPNLTLTPTVILPLRLPLTLPLTLTLALALALALALPLTRFAPLFYDPKCIGDTAETLRACVSRGLFGEHSTSNPNPNH